MTETPFACDHAPAATPWPPPYSVRVSTRARHARLRVLPGKGLEVVVPQGMDPALASVFVERHKEWVERTLRRVHVDEPGAEALPEAIVLHGGALQLPLCCAGEVAPCNAVSLRARRENTQAALAQLRRWVRAYAEEVLTRDVHALAEQYGFRFCSLRFGRQKSRWGSCSSQGAIRLNICLVFLPPELARHVLLHELAHTRHCNHGQQFWKLLFAVEPDALALDKRLRKAWRFVPRWLW